MSRQILVTGSEGQLGRELQRAAAGSDDKYIFTDIDCLDITDIEAIRRVVTENRVDVILNCAAYTNVDGAEDDKQQCDLINNLAVKNLATVTKEHNATLIHISTDYVFDGTSHTPYTENCATAPIGVYGTTKLQGERSIIDMRCNHIIIRTSWLYSAWGNNFVKTMQRLTSERDTLNVIFDQVGTPTYAGDLTDAIVGILTSDNLTKEGIYHYSNEGVCSWYDFAIEIAQLSGSECNITPIHSDEYPARVKRPHYSVLDKTKFKTTFGVKIPHWRESLMKCIKR